MSERKTGNYSTKYRCTKSNATALTASDVKKMKNRRKQNFEGEANNMQLDKEDTGRSN